MSDLKYFKEINGRGDWNDRSDCIYYFEVQMAEEDHLRRLIKYIEVDSKGSSFKCDVGNDPEHIMREQEDYNVSHGDFLNDVEPISKMEFDIIWVNVNYAS